MTAASLYRDFADTVDRLLQAVHELDRACALLKLEPLDSREWYGLLTQKLAPQLHDDAFLVVAVVGGTNIGKSVVFNHIAGTRASATSPLASGTKHPVCLVPPGFEQRHDLAEIFPGFELEPWEASESALEESAAHRLFWRTSAETPPNLLVLDTPDIDSDAPVNWRRADQIRRCADVLFAVLTQQKYNDAAVKQFFRKAASEDKAIIVVFNQCQLPDDEEYWPIWLETFTSETGVRPEFVYVAQNDRRAAEENRLPFYERPWPLNGEPPENLQTSRDLAHDLSQLHFSEIKLRTLRGSLAHLLDPEQGVPHWLNDIRRQSDQFRSAAERLSAESVVKINNWPVVPSSLLVQEAWQAWADQRTGWEGRVHALYGAIGQTVMWPLRFAREQLQGEPESPIEQYRSREWGAIVKTVEETFDKLAWMADSGSELLKPNFERLLEGKSRQAIVDRLRQEHSQLDLQEELRNVVRGQIKSFEAENPRTHKALKHLDRAAAVIRPATTVALAFFLVPAVDIAGHGLAQVAIERAGEVVVVVAGEQATAKVAGEGVGQLQAWLLKLHQTFTTRRVHWLSTHLKEWLLGSLPEDLQAAAAVPQSEPFQRIEKLLQRLEQQLDSQPQETCA